MSARRASGRMPTAVTLRVTSSTGRVGQVVGVEPPVLGVEGRDERVQALVRHRALAERAGQLEALMLVAQVGGCARIASARARPARRRARPAPAPPDPPRPTRERAARLRPRRCGAGWSPPCARTWRGCPCRASPDVESTPGRGGTTTVGISSSSARRQACSGPAPPKATRAKRRGIVPAPHRHRADGPRHGVVDDLHDARRRFLDAQAEAGRPTRASMAARAALTSRGSSPPRSAAGMRPSTRCASVTVGSLPAAAIAHRPRLGARAARPHGEPSRARHRRDAASARADRVDVHDGQLHREGPDHAVLGDLGPAVPDETDVRARPAHVDRDDVGEARGAPHAHRAHHPRGRDRRAPSARAGECRWPRSSRRRRTS